MTTLVPVTADDLAQQESVKAALARIEEWKRLIPTLGRDDADTLLHIRAWATALNAVAQAKAARDVAIRACVAQVLAERRLGQLLLEGAAWREELTAAEATLIRKVARIPDDLFSRLLADAERASRSVSAQWVYRRSRIESLEEIDRAIWRAWDGTYRVDTGFSKRWRDSLAGARATRDEALGPVFARLASSRAEGADANELELLEALTTEARRLLNAVRGAGILPPISEDRAARALGLLIADLEQAWHGFAKEAYAKREVTA